MQKQRFLGRFLRKAFIMSAMIVLGILIVRPTSLLSHGGLGGLGRPISSASSDSTSADAAICSGTGNGGDTVTLSVSSLTLGISLESLVSGMFNALFSPVLTSLCSFNGDIISWAQNQNFVFSTGDEITYDQPTVAKMYDAFLPVQIALIALLLAIGGHRIIFGASFSQVVPRIVLASVMTFGSPFFLRASIEVNNGLCALALQASLHNNANENIAGLLLGNGFGDTNWLGGLLIVLLSTGILLQDLIRIGLIDVLWVISPLVLLCYGEVGWQRWANLWMEAWIATVFLQFLQVLVLVLGAALVGNLGGITPVAIFVGLAILWLTFRVPGWLVSAVSGALTNGNSPDFGQFLATATQVAAAVATRMVP